MRAAFLIFCILVTAPVGACAKKQPTSRPVVIEDLIPFGTPVCFPTGMTNQSDEVGGDVEPATMPATTPTSEHTYRAD